MDELRKLLAFLYKDPTAARFLLADAGLAPEELYFDKAADVFWGDVLLTASPRGQVDSIVNAVVNAFPGRRDDLIAALGKFLRAPLVAHLSELFPEEADARTLVQQSGAAADAIGQVANVRAFWEAALAHATKGGKLSEIVKAAGDKFEGWRIRLARDEKDYIDGVTAIELQPPALRCRPSSRSSMSLLSSHRPTFRTGTSKRR